MGPRGGSRFLPYRARSRDQRGVRGVRRGRRLSRSSPLERRGLALAGEPPPRPARVLGGGRPGTALRRGPPAGPAPARDPRLLVRSGSVLPLGPAPASPPC